MSKIASFLAGMLAGAAALGIVAWLCADSDDVIPCSRDDDDDGCLKEGSGQQTEGRSMTEGTAIAEEATAKAGSGTRPSAGEAADGTCEAPQPA